MWPKKMECDGLPKESNDHQLCMDPAQETSVVRQSPISMISGPKFDQKNEFEEVPEDDCHCQTCPDPLVVVNQPWSVGGVENCALPCRNPYGFDGDSVEMVFLVFSAGCLSSVFVTCFVFWRGWRDFDEMERCILNFSLCFGGVALGKLIFKQNL